MHSSITLDRIMEAIEDGDNIGFCLNCGAETYGIEPDAREYTCESCGAYTVSSAENLLLRMA